MALGQAAKLRRPRRAFERAVESITKEKNKQELFKLLMVGVSVEVIVEGMLFQGFRDGYYTPDVGLLLERLHLQSSSLIWQKKKAFRIACSKTMML